MSGITLFSPASERNKEPIFAQIGSRFPASGKVLELACGSLQHALHFAPRLPSIRWQPTDINQDVIAYGRELKELPGNVNRPTYLDATDTPWPFSDMDVVYTANLLHISPLAVLSNLFVGARQALAKDGQVFVYGPFKIDGMHTSPSNEAFDLDLKSRDASWGIRDLQDVVNYAESQNFQLSEKIKMPANNLLLVFTIT